MSNIDLTQLGVVGIIALALLALAHAMKPLIQGLVDTSRENAEARKAVIERWEKSDGALDKNTGALESVVASLREVGDGLKRLNEIDQRRIEQNDATAAGVALVQQGVGQVQQDIGAIRSDIVITKDGTVNAMNAGFASQNGVLNKVTAGIEDLKQRVIKGDENVQAMSAKFDEMIALLKAQQKPVPAPPTEPPTNVPALPVLPPKTGAMFVYENWKDSTLFYETDNAPGIRWVRANSVEGVQGLANSALTTSTLTKHEGVDVLSLKAAPSKYPQSVGVRVVLTDEKRWTALQPHAGKTLYIRYWMLWPALPVLDEQGGTAGRWCSAGFQIKDDPNISALFQMNVSEKHHPFLSYRDGSEEDLLPGWKYTPNVWTRFDLTWKMTANHDGGLVVAIDGKPAFRAVGKSAAPSGFGSFHLLLYSDALKAPAELLIGPVIISTEPIP